MLFLKARYIFIGQKTIYLIYDITVNKSMILCRHIDWSNHTGSVDENVNSFHKCNMKPLLITYPLFMKCVLVSSSTKNFACLNDTNTRICDRKVSFIYRSIRKEITVRRPLIKYHKSIITTKPRINVTLKTTRTLGKTQVWE